MDKLFSIENHKDIIQHAITQLKLISGKDEFETARNQHMLNILQSMTDISEEWDNACSLNNELVGLYLLEELKNLPANKDDLSFLFSLCFRFLKELDLANKQTLTIELRTPSPSQFAVQNIEKFDEKSRNHIIYALFGMPIEVMKKSQNSDVINKIKNWNTTSGATEEKLLNWEKFLNEKEEQVTKLSETLEKYKTAFNFVGLYQGFDNLSQEKNKQLKWQTRWLVLFGLLLPAPFFISLSIIYNKLDNLALIKEYAILIGVPLASITIILLYFFRISLSNVTSTKSQLLQIDLRKTLCRFIQSYAEYSSDIKSKNQESLSKFESVVFSSIVSNDDKIPTTFDGIEQVGELIKSLRGKE